MGILTNIFNKIFPSSHAAPTGAPAAMPSAPGTPAPPPSSTPVSASSTSPAVNPTPAAMTGVDVEQLLDGLVHQAPEKLNWRTSIVDLMKLLGIDSSLAARKELAQELQYSGDTNDSATMNIWLHRQVMNKLAANGGKVPADLKD